MSKSSVGAFGPWLNEKLRELNTDESVFGAYITGILEGDESQEEKSEALTDILSEIINNDLEQVVTAILNKWNECQPKEEETTKRRPSIDVNEQLAKLLEAQKLQTTVKERVMTEEERRVRDQILAQYSQTAVSDEEGEDYDDDDGETAGGGAAGGGGGGGGGLERNTNAHDVMQLQKERREQSRLDSAAKKQKDKEDREKQKQMREEKKEKRKTVKGERRR